VVVGRDHPMADNHGYVLEHRLVMSKGIGRMLLPEERVSFVNGDREDCRPENLLLFADGSSFTAWCRLSGHGGGPRAMMPAVAVGLRDPKMLALIDPRGMVRAGTRLHGRDF
jgi:hypothetical protein